MLLCCYLQLLPTPLLSCKLVYFPYHEITGIKMGINVRNHVQLPTCTLFKGSVYILIVHSRVKPEGTLRYSHQFSCLQPAHPPTMAEQLMQKLSRRKEATWKSIYKLCSCISNFSSLRNPPFPC